MDAVILKKITVLMSILAVIFTFDAVADESDWLAMIAPDATTAIITGYTGTKGDISIPKSIQGYKVSGIGERAFEGNDTITSVNLYSSGKFTIGDYAFANCKNLTTVSGLYTLEEISAGCFSGCTALKDVGLSFNKIKKIGFRAFQNTTSLELSEFAFSGDVSGRNAWIIEIHSEAFKGSGITKLMITDNMRFVNDGGVGEWFSDCNKLEKVTISYRHMDNTVSLPLPSKLVSSKSLSDVEIKYSGKMQSDTFFNCPALPLSVQSKLQQYANIRLR